MMPRLVLAAALFLKTASSAFAQEMAVPAPDWNPNLDRPYTTQYIRRELTLSVEQADPRRGISGVIRNDGDKTLTRVRALLKFFNADDQLAGEYEFSALPWAGPVAPGEPEEKPLGPGGSRRFLVYPSSVPSGWSDQWKAEIEAVTFAWKEESQNR